MASSRRLYYFSRLMVEAGAEMAMDSEMRKNKNRIIQEVKLRDKECFFVRQRYAMSLKRPKKNRIFAFLHPLFIHSFNGYQLRYLSVYQCLLLILPFILSTFSPLHIPSMKKACYLCNIIKQSVTTFEPTENWKQNNQHHKNNEHEKYQNFFNGVSLAGHLFSMGAAAAFLRHRLGCQWRACHRRHGQGPWICHRSHHRP